MGRPREVDDATLFEATFRTLCRLGYARLSLAPVAQAAGVSPALLVKRFGSKRDLLLAFADWSNDVSRAQFGTAREASESPLDALYARYRLRVEYVSDPLSLANLLSFYAETAADPAFAERGARRVQMQHAEIGQLLDEAIARGELRHCDVSRVSRVLLAAVNGVFALWNLNDDRTPTDALHEVFDVVLGPLRVAHPTPTAAEVSR